MIDVSQTGQSDRSLATQATRLASAQGHDGAVLAERQTDAAAPATNDSVAVTAPVAAEAGAAAARLRRLSDAGTLLQTADAALSKIQDKLDELSAIAVYVAETDLSDFERSRLDSRFREIRKEIDTIAGAAHFNGEPILQGGTGTGGAYGFSTAIDEETGGLQAVEIPKVSVEDLDASFATADVTSVSAAENASTSIDAAQATLSDVQTSVRSQLRQIGTETFVNSAAYASNAADDTRDKSLEKIYEPPALAKDIAEQVTRQGGIDLSGGAERTMRQLLLSLSTVWSGQTSSGSSKADDAWKPQQPTPSPAQSSDSTA